MLYKLLAFWLRRVHSRLAPLIATVGIVGFATCLFIVLGLARLFEEVLGENMIAFDTSWLLWLHQFSSPTLNAVMLTITRFGNSSVVVIVAGVGLAILWFRHYRQEAKFFAFACLGGAILSRGLKLAFSKPRPELWPRLTSATSFSFPSGHALGSMVLYGFLAYLLATHCPKFSQIIYGLAAAAIAAIGLSRMYLGVHWPTDVIAGYGVGFLWLTICITMLKLQKLRQV